MPLYTIEDLTFTYPGAPAPALKGVTLEVEHGSFTCLIGRNGSGKSTLLRHLKPALTPAGSRSGSILFEGRDLSSLSLAEQCKLIGFVFQDAQDQIVTSSVIAEIAFGLESLGISRAAMRARVAEICTVLGITAWADTPISELSSGQAELVNIAAALATEPRILIADEPTNGLDPLAADEVISMLARINRDLGTTIILSTQTLDRYAAYVDTLIVLETGVIKGEGSIRSVGAELFTEGSALFDAFPAPFRIYAECTAAKTDLMSASEQSRSLEHVAPLTIREGRAWLSRELGDVENASSSQPGRDASQAGFDMPADLRDCERGVAPAPALSMRGVRFRFTKNDPDVLKDVDLVVPSGHLCALLGANASGKTTLLRCAGGLLRPYKGKVELGSALASCSRQAVMLPQDATKVFSKETVQEEIIEMEPLATCSHEEFMARMAKLAEMLEIGPLLNKDPFDLSGGEAQRVGLAKALLADARLYLLDEPTCFLDVQGKRVLAELLRALAMADRSVLFTSHDLDFCAHVADTVALLFEGSVDEPLAPAEIFSTNAYLTTPASLMARASIPGAYRDQDVIDHVIACNA